MVVDKFGHYNKPIESNKGLIMLNFFTTINLEKPDIQKPGYFIHTFQSGSRRYLIPIKGTSKIVHYRCNDPTATIYIDSTKYDNIKDLTNSKIKYNDIVVISTTKQKNKLFLELVIEYTHKPASK